MPVKEKEKICGLSVEGSNHSVLITAPEPVFLPGPSCFDTGSDIPDGKHNKLIAKDFANNTPRQCAKTVKV